MQMDDFMSHALLWLIGSVVGAGFIGILFVTLVTKSPKYERPRGRGGGGLGGGRFRSGALHVLMCGKKLGATECNQLCHLDAAPYTAKWCPLPPVVPCTAGYAPPSTQLDQAAAPFNPITSLL